MKRVFRGGCAIACDIKTSRKAKPCGVVFTTYSMPSVARAQAKHVGWSRPKLRMLRDWKLLEEGSDGRRQLDACPVHTAAIADDAKLLEVERAQAKANKAMIEAEAARVRAQKRAQRAARRLAREQEKQDRQARRAARKQERGEDKERSTAPASAG